MTYELFHYGNLFSDFIKDESYDFIDDYDIFRSMEFGYIMGLQKLCMISVKNDPADSLYGRCYCKYLFEF